MYETRDVFEEQDVYVEKEHIVYTNEAHRYGYQGQYAEMDTVTGWNAFELRMYDPLIGRFLQVDPARQFASSYVGMGNNPLVGTDPTGGICDTCPEGAEYDQYRNTDQVFNFADGIVFNGQAVTVTGTTGTPLMTASQFRDFSSSIQNKMTAVSIPMAALQENGFWIGETSKGNLKLYRSRFNGNQYTRNTNLIKNGGAFLLAVNVGLDAGNLLHDPDYADQFALNTTIGVSSLYLQPQAVVMILVLQNAEEIAGLVHYGIDVFAHSEYGQGAVMGLQEMTNIDNYTRIQNSENMFGFGNR